MAKPGMTAAHNQLEMNLGFILMSQLDRSAYSVRIDAGRVHRPGATYYIPDVFVVPMALVTPLLDQQDVLEVYDQPLPLVVEVWSRSTGDYDVGVLGGQGNDKVNFQLTDIGIPTFGPTGRVVLDGGLGVDVLTNGNTGVSKANGFELVI